MTVLRWIDRVLSYCGHEAKHLSWPRYDRKTKTYYQRCFRCMRAVEYRGELRHSA